MSPHRIRHILFVFEYRRLWQAVLPLQHYVADPQALVLRHVRGAETAGHGLLPAGPPLMAEILQIIGLAAGLPIDVDRAQGFGAEYARIEAVGRIGKEE